MQNSTKILSTTASALSFFALSHAAQAAPSYQGDWLCEGGLELKITEDTYSNGGETYPVGVDAYGDEAIIAFLDGSEYFIALMEITDTSMVWSSPSSGDMFPCKRQSSAKMPAAISTSLSPSETPQSTQTFFDGVFPDAGWSESGVQDVLFDGAWSCQNGAFDLVITEDNVSLPKSGRTIAIEEISSFSPGTRDIVLSDGTEFLAMFKSPDTSELQISYGDMDALCSKID